MAITTRAGKGSALTHTELDTNFTDLNTLKLDKAGGTMTGQLLVTMNTSTDALRITQTGAGNALVVEDSANPDSTPFVVDANGNLGIGTTTPTQPLDIAGNKLRLRTSNTPASATATGSAGEICWDASYLYICTATNTWRRIAHSTW